MAEVPVPKGKTARRRKPRASLSSILQRVGGAKGEEYRGTCDPLDLIVLQQIRVTFEDLDAFAEGMTGRQLQPIIVARFTSRTTLRAYLQTINRLWGRRYQVSRYRPNAVYRGHAAFDVLIAGEKRVRAFRHLAEHGCQSCRDQGETKGCFRKHYRAGLVKAEFYIDPHPMQALFAQALENSHKRPREEEEARGFSRLFRLARSVDSSFSLSAFAHSIGRPPETVRKGLRFCAVPLKIQEAVENGDIPYGIAAEIGRLQPFLPPEELGSIYDRYVATSVVNRTRVPDFRAKVTLRILELQNASGDLFDGMQFRADRAAMLAERRRTVTLGFNRELDAGQKWMALVLKLLMSGKLGPIGTPFADGAVRKRLRGYIELQRLILEHGRWLYKQIDAQRLEHLCDDTEAVLDDMEAALAEVS